MVIEYRQKHVDKRAHVASMRVSKQEYDRIKKAAKIRGYKSITQFIEFCVNHILDKDIR